MISRDIRNHITLSFRETGQFGVFDQIERMFVVRFVRDVITEVVKQRGRRKHRTMVPIKRR